MGVVKIQYTSTPTNFASKTHDLKYDIMKNYFSLGIFFKQFYRLYGDNTVCYLVKDTSTLSQPSIYSLITKLLLPLPVILGFYLFVFLFVYLLNFIFR